MKQYSSKNGWYKYYNKDGLSCRIKVDESALTRKNKPFTIFWYDREGWNAHIPRDKKGNDKVFRDVFDVIKHILKNLEHDRLVFKIL